MAVGAPPTLPSARRRGTTAEGRRSFLGVVPASVFLILLFAGPIAILVLYSFGFLGHGVEPSLGFYTVAVTDPFFRSVLLSTIRLGLVVTFFCVLLGYPIAWAIVRAEGTWKVVLIGLLIAPLLTNQVVRTFGWIVLLSNQGIVNSIAEMIHPALVVRYLGRELSVVIALVHIFLPFLVLPLLNTLENLPANYREAAMASGAHPIVSFVRITFPLSSPGVIAGSTLVFILATSSLVTPLILGQGRVWVITTFIWQQIQITQWGRGSAMAIILTLTALSAVYVSQLAQNRVLGNTRSTRGRPKRRPIALLLRPLHGTLRNLRVPGRWLTWARNGYLVAFFAFLLLPLLVVLPTAFDAEARMQATVSDFTLRWFAEALTSPEWREAFFLSLRVALAAVVLGLVLGVPAAYAVAKGTFPGRNSILTFMISPLAVPTMVMGLGFILYFQMLGMRASFTLLVLVHVVVIFAQLVRVLAGGFESFDPRWEEAAVTSGARRLTMYRRILLPTMRPAIMAAAIFGFLISFDEVTVTVLVSRFGDETLPVRMFRELTGAWSPVIAAVSTLLILFSIVVLCLIGRFVGFSAYRTMGKP